MLTLQDCLELADLTEDELDAIAHHEHLPAIVAIEKAHAFLQQDWGAPAVRQMVIDEVHVCLKHHDPEKVAQALRTLDYVFQAHPGGHDRRLGGREQAAAT